MGLFRKKVNGYVIKPGADLRRADLRLADLVGKDLNRADLSGANLAGVDLAGANLTAVKWSNTTCPDGQVTSEGC